MYKYVNIYKYIYIHITSSLYVDEPDEPCNPFVHTAPLVPEHLAGLRPDILLVGWLDTHRIHGILV